MLGFQSQVESLEKNELTFYLNFSNPDSISSGTEKDLLLIEFLDPSFFQAGTQKVEEGQILEIRVPKVL